MTCAKIGRGNDKLGEQLGLLRLHVYAYDIFTYIGSNLVNKFAWLIDTKNS